MSQKNSFALSSGFWKNARFDFPAGLVVFLVALPLCLGISLASEAPLFSGVITGIIAGIVVGTLSGSELSVSGPAAGLTVVVAMALKTLGSFDAFLVAVLLSGVIQMGLGFLGAGVIGGIFPTSVIKGMLAAIGFIIILKQIPHGMGRDLDYEGDMGFWEIVGHGNTFSDIVHAFFSYKTGAVIVCLVSIAILLVWEWKKIKEHKFLKLVPGPLMAVLLGTLVNEYFRISGSSLYVSGDEGHLVALPVVQKFSDFWGQMHFPSFSALKDPKIYTTALTIAVIGSVETLLCIEASDKLDPFRRISSKNKELKAQGIGNILSGLLGGLPMTSVIVRSSANIYAGARTRLSAIVHGFLLLLSVLLIPTLLNKIPLATLAAVLMVVGYKLTSFAIFKKMYKLGWDQFIPFVATVLGILFTDILVGVMIGMLVGLLFVVKTNHYSAIVVLHEGNNFLVKFTKDVSFINKVRLKNELEKIPANSFLVIDGTKSMFIDNDIYDVINDFSESANFNNIRIETKNIESKQYKFSFRI